MFLMLALSPLVSAQKTIKKKDAKRTIEMFEGKKVQITRFRVMSKRRAYKLSKDMNKFNYNVVFVVYQVDGREYTRIFDQTILQH